MTYPARKSPDHAARAIVPTLLASLLVYLSADLPAGAAVAGCQIEVAQESNGLHLRAMANAHDAVAGKYEFVVIKASEAGASRSVQTGAFVLRPGDTQVLTSLVLDPSAVGHYKATLSLEWDEGKESCVSP